MSCPYANNNIQKQIPVQNINYTEGRNALDEIIGPDPDETPVVPRKSHTAKETLNYITYLGLDQLLSSLSCLSVSNESDGKPVHDEHFFIILHQAFELWFKQFIFEIDSIREVLIKTKYDETQNVLIISRLVRCVKIWQILIEQLHLLETTMTPLTFLSFRSYVTPASGFQSLQFRLIENKLGLTDKLRQEYKQTYFLNKVFTNGEQNDQLRKSIDEQSLLQLIEVMYV
ncbi:unnamed protein product [Didymodactylos carnosus]|uniref:Tryptophan 2,3-dioxygenase n=1 Tax=Didymodactylos carnosus TaxID=1234261 RepID=A0A816BP46_9BILA|nr:unnamed protein product [Didymodactylos carnosus]CAF1611622.1 unnamed protein product [Didymodactylos carnosus]CAF3580438.1 unnamed protein product [Didymodactylos carnosus]CAF4494724.1 unnamed protein product [Didymodactylos carnosus]